MFLGFASPDQRSRQETSSLSRAEIRRIQKAAKDHSIGRVYPLEMKEKQARDYSTRKKMANASGDASNHYSSFRIRASDNLWLPQILIGASNSSKTGWLMKISRAFMQSARTSFSAKFTCFPGLLPRTSSSLSITLSISRSGAAMLQTQAGKARAGGNVHDFSGTASIQSLLN